jgi:hypothetical protein
MTQFPHVEDYLELLAGYDPDDATNILGLNNFTFNLARYDVNIINSMASDTKWHNQALSDRQSELAVKLIMNYRRQFAKQGIDITPVETPVFRLQPRKIDRTRTLSLTPECMILKFPYDKSMIAELQEYKKNSQGNMHWDHNSKAWHCGITEANVNWLVTWSSQHGFEIDPAISEMFEQILVCEQTPYEIKLMLTQTLQGLGLTITNAAPSLVDYINEHLGGFGLENAVKLIDYSGVLGYTYDENLIRPALLDIFKDQRSAHIVRTADGYSWDRIFDYAEIVGRYPICIFDPGLIGVDLSRFDERDILRFNTSGKTKTCDYNIHDVKVVYANKIPPTWTYPVPLLVSTAHLMHGGNRAIWLNTAEKIIYHCETLLRENN